MLLQLDAKKPAESRRDLEAKRVGIPDGREEEHLGDLLGSDWCRTLVKRRRRASCFRKC